MVPGSGEPSDQHREAEATGEHHGEVERRVEQWPIPVSHERINRRRRGEVELECRDERDEREDSKHCPLRVGSYCRTRVVVIGLADCAAGIRVDILCTVSVLEVSLIGLSPCDEERACEDGN